MLKLFVKNKIIQNIDTLLSTVGKDNVAGMLSEDGVYEKMKDSMTNDTYKITWNGEPYVLRIPGAGTDKFVNRAREEFYTKQAVERGCCPATEFYNQGKVKLTKYIENARTFDCTKDDIRQAVDLLQRFYSSTPGEERSLLDEIRAYEELYNDKSLIHPEYGFVKQVVLDYLYDENGNKKYTLEISHGDTIPFNFLINGSGMHLIDYEYSGMLSKSWDYGSFVSELELYQNIDRNKLISEIAEIDKTINTDTVLTWSYIVDFIWACWGWAKTGSGVDYNEYSNERFTKALKFYLQYATHDI